MITQETLFIDGVELVKTYSDTYHIQQLETGIIYTGAIDVPNKYTYMEVEDQPLIVETEMAEEIVEPISTEE